MDNASSEDKASADSVSLSLSLTGSCTASEIVMSWGSVNSLKDDYFMMQFSHSLSMTERIERRKRVRKENPGASEEEVKAIYRARLLEEAREAHISVSSHYQNTRFWSANI